MRTRAGDPGASAPPFDDRPCWRARPIAGTIVTDDTDRADRSVIDDPLPRE